MPRFLSLLMTLFCATTALWAAFTPSAFTVAANGKQVLFSQGNLQCTLSATDTTWSFAEFQTDMLGEANISGSSLADKIDLFGWSGNNETAKWGISTSFDVSDYSGDFVDWGTNTIGTNAPNTYRTLTRGEWDYLLNTRSNAGEKKGIARIKLNDDGSQYANGLILLPDSWTCPEDVTFKSGFEQKKDYADHQTFTLDQWQKLEAAGAVFLPASGDRDGSSMRFVQYYSGYWSTTANGSEYAYYLCFYTTGAFTYSGNYRCMGRPVRLVQDIKYAISITQPEHGTIAADKEACAEGRTVTLTLSPNAYYAPKTITVLQGETPITTTAVAGTTNQYTFTMPAGEVTITAEFEKVSSAFTPVAFTVSESGKQVYFSQGNLQCSGLTTQDTTWSFAEYQTDMLGTANISSGTLADKIDLFGWSGNNTTAPWGISTTTSASNYSGDFVDWGTNTIGTYAPNTYRTLTKDEWLYLFNTRTNASNLKGVARIKLNDEGSQYANGLILLPDNWICPTDVTFNSGFADSDGVEYYATNQTFTLAEWQKLESAGAVFLPASGYRDGSVMYYVQNRGYYRSATANGSEYAYNPSFYSNKIDALSDNRRYYGLSVRLVQDANYTISIVTPEHGSIAADKTTALAGETVTLTITPDVYYTLKKISVLQGETVIATSAVAGTTDQYTFTIPAGDVTIAAEFEKLPSAFTPVAFTVSESGKQVLFSQGNLQCTLSATDTTWSFADHQTDIIGTANVSGYSPANKIDLFGWSGSAGKAKWGISTSNAVSDYSGDFVDWGTNTIGTHAPNTYRTLTKDEWEYLINTRTNASEKKGVARINFNSDGSQYANGLILLPDSWTCPKDVTFKSGLAGNSCAQCYADYQTFTLAEWKQLESAGAVFLPASGNRNKWRMSDVLLYGNYWSATVVDLYEAYSMGFGSNIAGVFNYSRTYGRAVRLVQDVKYAIMLTQPQHGTIAADKTESVAGDTITLTITPNDAYYAPKTVTVLQGETPVTTTAVAGTTNQYTFIMPAGEVNITAEFEKVASAFMSAKFTISADGKHVLFSQGNLQCTLSASDTTWSFAEYQTEMIGEANMSSGALADKIDLFGWSGSTGTAKWGIGISTDYNDYAGDFVDWGTNTIGTHAPNTYRTLTYDEWYYLLNTRTDADSKKGVARIKLSETDYANGLILLPDSWDCPADIAFKSGFSGEFSVEAYAIYQTFTLAEWQKLEAAGAVFLPASGYRYESRMDLVQNYGLYWSATAYGPDGAYRLYFSSDEANAYSRCDRYRGLAVRLVQDVPTYAITITQPDHGSIAADKTEAAAGEKITLTITPATGYELEAIAVKDAEERAVALSADHTFTMPASNVTVSATFKLQTFTITTHAENGTVTGGGTYDYGTEVELTATPKEGYTFSQWSDGTTTNPYRFMVTEDRTIEAVFAEVPSAVDNIADPAGTTVLKVLRNGQVLILRGGKTYTTTGLEVK